tara:strand:+ start:316 stop:804 length:489 start_codon:yes stop_codon:yes gene_type:complete
MNSKNYNKNNRKFIQGLRSFKDTLPRNIKRIIIKKGHIYSETLNNWKNIVGNEMFRVCYPKSFKSSNKINASCLTVMVKRGNEVEMEYSKNKIIDRINSYFGYKVVEKLKLISFDSEISNLKKEELSKKYSTNKKYTNKIINIKNDKVKKSLIELSKFFKKK